MIFLTLETELFYYEHLLDSSYNLQLIQDFCVTNTSGYGLERYIKELAESDEKDGSARTYLVKDRFTHEIVAYFSLKTGLFTIDAGNDYFYSISGIELANFAVNSSYRKNHPDAKNLGSTVFAEFVLPFVNFIRSLVGIQAIYIYALPEDKLIKHYKTMGFHRLDPEDEQFVHQHVKPKYDEGCVFMYQLL